MKTSKTLNLTKLKVVALSLFLAMPFAGRADDTNPNGNNGNHADGGNNGNGKGNEGDSPSTPVNTNLVILALAGGTLVTTAGFLYKKNNSTKSISL
jgi:hypothetical protein